MSALNLHKTGFGLGLTLTKKIISRMKGKWRIKSIPDVGTKVIFTVPLMIFEPENLKMD